jgi:C6 transcription factor Pro1
MEKPEWMDGGNRQEEMARQVKQAIKASRRGECAQPQEGAGPQMPTPISSLATPTAALPYGGHIPGNEPNLSAPQAAFKFGVGTDAAEEHDAQTGWPDALLFTFYFEHVLPFLFPFYRPSVYEGGRSWIIDMMMSSPVVRKTALCQSTYFFSLALGTRDCAAAWVSTVLS